MRWCSISWSSPDGIDRLQQSFARSQFNIRRSVLNRTNNESQISEIVDFTRCERVKLQQKELATRQCRFYAKIQRKYHLSGFGFIFSQMQHNSRELRLRLWLKLSTTHGVVGWWMCVSAVVDTRINYSVNEQQCSRGKLWLFSFSPLVCDLSYCILNVHNCWLCVLRRESTNLTFDKFICTTTTRCVWNVLLGEWE